jgi:hypothetical protein
MKPFASGGPVTRLRRASPFAGMLRRVLPSKQIHLRRADERALGHELPLPPALRPLLVIAGNPNYS